MLKDLEIQVKKALGMIEEEAAKTEEVPAVETEIKSKKK